MSIRTKYLLLLTLLAIVAAGLAAGLTSYLLSSSFERVSRASEKRVAQALIQQLEQEAIRRTQLLAWSLSDAIYHVDIQTIKTLISASLSHEGVREVAVYDSAGQVLYDGAEGVKTVGAALERDIVRQALASGRLAAKIHQNDVEVTTPVVIGRRLIGGVYMRLDKKIVANELAALRRALTEIEAESEARRDTVMLVLMAVFSFFGILTAIYISRNMADPVRLLTRYTGLIGKVPAADIAYDLYELGAREDEIGQLSRSIVATTKELEATTVSRNHVSALLRAMPDPIFVVALTGEIEEVTPAMVEQLGRSAEELCGRDYREFLECGALDLDSIISQKVSSIAGLEGRLTHQGTPVSVAAAAFLDSASKNPCVVIAVRDIEELVKVQNALRATRDEAQAANLAKSTFLANMSHEFRTPLNAIIGFTDLLLLDQSRRMTPEQQQEYFQIIRDSGHHLLGIINDVLDMSKIETGKMELHAEMTLLKKPVESAVNMMSGRAKEARTEISLELDASLEAVVDSRLFRQVALNLIANAIKFTTAGGRILVVLRRNHQGQVVFAVIDNGIGMNQEDAKRVLHPFEQADASLSRTYEGTGLGLPLVTKMVELHGGIFRLLSRPGRGTVAFVRLPRR